MTEPFMPRHHHEGPADAADPGATGAADSVTETELDQQVGAFEERLDADRDKESLFRTPRPTDDPQPRDTQPRDTQPTTD